MLFDDVLSALDVHTARWIVEKCLTGDLLRGRTVILVTHNVAMAGPVAQHVVSISSNGSITGEATIAEILSKDSVLRAEIADENLVIEKAEEAIDGAGEAPKEGKTPSGKLVADEEVAIGHLSKAAGESLVSSCL